jgi:hypothetical protein
MYDPTVGRFLEEDPIGIEAGDPNFYRYCGNGPANAVDPWGLWGVGIGTDGNWTADQIPHDFGHSDFYNPGGYFNFNTEDGGWTRPEIPWSTWRHFQTLEEAEAAAKKALDAGDKNAFERAMHDMQDFYSHRKQGWKAWNGDIALKGAEIGAEIGSLGGPWSTLAGAGIGSAAGWGHTWASIQGKAGLGPMPDDAIDYKNDFIKANERTKDWVDKWRAKWACNG